MTILAEELHLLALDPEGAKSTLADLNTGAVGAVLLDLALAERITLDGKKVTVTDPRPLGHPVLDTVLARVGTDKPRSPRSWHSTLYWGQSQRVLDHMAERGLLTVDKRRLLGFIPTTTYPPTRPGLRAEIQRRLADAVAAGSAPDPRTAALAGLLHALRLEKRALPDHGPGARAALKSITEYSWADEAVREAVAGTQAAITLAITAAIAATAASAGG